MGLFDNIKSVFSTEQTTEEKAPIKITKELLEEFQNSAEGQLKIIEARII